MSQIIESIDVQESTKFIDVQELNESVVVQESSEPVVDEESSEPVVVREIEGVKFYKTMESIYKLYKHGDLVITMDLSKKDSKCFAIFKNTMDVGILPSLLKIRIAVSMK